VGVSASRGAASAPDVAGGNAGAGGGASAAPAAMRVPARAVGGTGDGDGDGTVGISDGCCIVECAFAVEYTSSAAEFPGSTEVLVCVVIVLESVIQSSGILICTKESSIPAEDSRVLEYESIATSIDDSSKSVEYESIATGIDESSVEVAMISLLIGLCATVYSGNGPHHHHTKMVMRAGRRHSFKSKLHAEKNENNLLRRCQHGYAV
jgi:hypothetical protein